MGDLAAALRRGAWRPRAVGVGLLAALWTVAACGGSTSAGAHTAADSTTTDSGGVATPVTMATVTRGTIDVIVSGPGHTDALDLQTVRAPFAGTLQTLTVAVGDQVAGGQAIATMVSQNSQAALNGAQAMLASATTPAQRRDAERALALARRSLVTTTLRAPRAGTVVSRAASAGNLVAAGSSIAAIATAGSIVFVAEIAQSDLPRVHPGDRARIEFPGRTVPVIGTVHGVLPVDSASLMIVPVRIDLSPSAAMMPRGIFGTAHITVGSHAGATTVPAPALLRDDVTGVSRVAVVDARGRAHWVTVTPGIVQGAMVEITAPPIAAGTRVITSGQVGLPDGTPVREVPADSAAMIGSGGVSQ